MATLALAAAGAAIGGALLPGGISLLGITIGGAALGASVGLAVGSYVDQTFLTPTTRIEGPRVKDLYVQTSTEGAPIPRVYGRMRISPQVIWATKFLEIESTEEVAKNTEQVSYKYYCSFAIALCEGEIAGILKVWADGKPLDLSDTKYKTTPFRVYNGTEDQEPDPKIIAVEGEVNAPAYRGLAYMVFENFPLEDFGNRVPQLTVEVLRKPPASGPDQLEGMIRAVTLIPGTTESGYDSKVIMKKMFGALFAPLAALNKNTANEKTDLEVSLEQLKLYAPNIRHISFVVAWHGTDLRCGECKIRPKVEGTDIETFPDIWRVSGITRAGAVVVSHIPGGGVAYGGAPADISVYRAIRKMKEMGFEVTIYPFIMMDVPAGNGLPDPYGGAEQAVYPWRGRITCHPAPGRSGTPDKTAAAVAQVAAFFGTAQPEHLNWAPVLGTAAYSGPVGEWSFRRFILNLAEVARAAGQGPGGPVDAFMIGSEMVGLTTVRDGPSSYPAVQQFRFLAADVRSKLGPEVKILYAADWSEYSGHRPGDGSGDVHFHLDPLWADANIDAVGIDAYFPLADWRDGPAHLDILSGAHSQLDLDYLRGNVEGGEGYDWYYASYADRVAQVRTPIVDSAHGEHWVFRTKDVRSWWSNAHHNRPGGVRSASSTSWVPQSKPIWLTEVGCSAVDKGANQPNVFVDPKSSESFYPYFSSGARNDEVQRSYLEAMLGYWADPGNNPISMVYGGRMIESDRLYIWTWDARPYPDFPQRTNVWSDAPNWRLGHWITGRLGMVPLRDVVAEIAGGYGVPLDVSNLQGLVTGYTLDRIMSAREALEPLRTAYFFDGCESEGLIRFTPRGSAPVASFALDDLVDAGDGSFRVTRGQESELPIGAKLRYVDIDSDYRQGTVEARRLKGGSQSIAEPSIAVAMDNARAQGIVDALLIEAHVGRERAEIVLPPSALALDPGDVVILTLEGRTLDLRLDSVGYEFSRPARGVRSDMDVYRGTPAAANSRPPATVSVLGAPTIEFIDLPLLSGAEVAHAPHIGAYADPWGPVVVQRGVSTSYAADVVLSDRTLLGALVEPLPRGRPWLWDRAHDLVVEIPPGMSLASADEMTVLSGGNTAAVRAPSGDWEIVQWREATLVAPNTYRLSRLLRGQRGTEHVMGDPTPAGARFVLIGSGLRQSGTPIALRGLAQDWRWGPQARPVDDWTWAVGTFGAEGIGLRPFAPCRLAAARDASGDISITWVRRSRLPEADGWEAEVPLGEESERYVLEILDGAAVQRTFNLTAPAVLYTAAMQTADFGVPVASVDVRLRQVSTVFGRGAALTATI